MKRICELNDEIILGRPGRSCAEPRRTARAIVRKAGGHYAVMYAEKYGLYSLPGGGVEPGENVLTALRREILEETGCTCDEVEELGIIEENRCSLDYTQINYYFVVTATPAPQGAQLTDAEAACKTQLQWHTYLEMVDLITGQQFDRIQGKYLRARDVAALREYKSRMMK